MRKNKFIIEIKMIYEKMGEYLRRVEGVVYYIERFDKCLVFFLFLEGIILYEKFFLKNLGLVFVKIEEKYLIKIWCRFFIFI